MNSGNFKSFCASALLTVIFHCKLNAADFEGCDDEYSLEPDKTVILESPRYPGRYPSQTACRYTFVAPVGCQIDYACDVNLDQGSDECTSELFYISRSGDKELRDSNQYCGDGKVTQSSYFRLLVMAYKSEKYSRLSGFFKCYVTARRQPCDCGWYKKSRIAGGRQTNIIEYPSMAALVRDGKQYCGGTIVSSTYIATAGHCVAGLNAGDIAAVVGVDNLKNVQSSPYAAAYEIVDIIVHALYDPKKTVNDIAVLRTSKIIEYSLGVAPVCIPFSRANDDFTYNEVQIVGFGTTSFGGLKSDELLSATVTITTDEVCKNTYPDLESTQCCTFWYGRDSCQYDSGGPVLLELERIYLVGVISIGKPCNQGPGLNTRFTEFISWIYEIVGAELCYRPM